MEMLRKREELVKHSEKRTVTCGNQTSGYKHAFSLANCRMFVFFTRFGQQIREQDRYFQHNTHLKKLAYKVLWC